MDPHPWQPNPPVMWPSELLYLISAVYDPMYCDSSDGKSASHDHVVANMRNKN